jgi:CTP:molybdopterin cytidylyltransferase MocA
MRLGGIVLAAGAGVRMGGPKALLLAGGEPLARIHARRMRDAGCASVVIVTRAELADRFEKDDIVAVSSAPDPAGSLAVGLGRLQVTADTVLVIAPVDAWPARVETIHRLVEAIDAGAEAATPRFEGRGGHPVVIRARALAAYTAAPRPLRDLLAMLGRERVRVDVDDPAVATDLDTPADVVALTGEAPRFA